MINPSKTASLDQVGSFSATRPDPTDYHHDPCDGISFSLESQRHPPSTTCVLDEQSKSTARCNNAPNIDARKMMTNGNLDRRMCVLLAWNQ